MIRAHGPAKKFGEFTAVDTIAFDVAQDAIFAFLGLNGYALSPLDFEGFQLTTALLFLGAYVFSKIQI